MHYQLKNGTDINFFCSPKVRLTRTARSTIRREALVLSTLLPKRPKVDFFLDKSYGQLNGFISLSNSDQFYSLRMSDRSASSLIEKIFSRLNEIIDEDQMKDQRKIMSEQTFKKSA